MTKKALVLFSGGLDSLLAVKILEEQNFKVTGICFVSNFFNAEKAKVISQKNNIKLKIVNIYKSSLGLVKNPPNGHGKNLNPCIDCHSLMISYAGKIAKKENFVVIATGEVLGQRPFSQNKEALKRVSKISGIDILRPLSAKLLLETKVEKKGIVNREKLCGIMGRSRDIQKKLIKKYKITDYSAPAGGCILTDAGFCKRLSKMLDYWPDCDYIDVELLKHGRVFWFNLKSEKILAIIGRHQQDNENLEKLKKDSDILCQLKEIPGPVTLSRTIENNLKINNKVIKKNIPKKIDLKLFDFNCENVNEFFNKVALLTAYYVVNARGKKVKIVF